MQEFTPVSALVGGTLIGLAALLLLVAIGRVAGISGIVAGTLVRSSDGRAWRVAFLCGLLAGSALVRLGGFTVPVEMVAGTPGIVFAGLCVGLGTRLANGCTSGHGVCGIARLSPRSLAATATFMTTGALTVFVLRHVWGGGF